MHPALGSMFSFDSIAGALSTAAFVLFVVGLTSLVLRRRAHSRESLFDHLPSMLGCIALLAHLVVVAAHYRRLPIGNLAESSVLLALLMAVAYLVAITRLRYPAVDMSLLVMVIGFLGLGLLLPGTAVAIEAAPPAGSRWFVLHVILAMLGVTTLFASCLASVLYLLSEGQLKGKRPTVLLRFLPSLVACDQAALRLLAFGFPLLTMAIVSGWVWGRVADRQVYGAKELWAGVAWVIYAVLLYMRLARGWRGRRAALVAVIGAFAVLVAFLGIRL